MNEPQPDSIDFSAPVDGPLDDPAPAPALAPLDPGPLDVPLIGWDLMADLAVLGPVQSEVPAPPIGAASKPAIGSDLFTIGYPGEVEPYPQPAISRGVLSRYRHWPDQEITYLQTARGRGGAGLAVGDAAVIVDVIYEHRRSLPPTR